MPELLSFKSGGQNLSALLFLPDNYRPDVRYTALIIDGPMTGLKDQVAAVYARKLSEKGIISLAFDHRYYGESEGKPRQYESPTAKIEDIHNAVTYMQSRADVDKERLGGAGIGAGGGYMAVAVATDKRMKAFASIAGCFLNPKMMKTRMGPAAYYAAIARSQQAEERYHSTGEVEYIPAVSIEGSDVAMPGAEPYAYYGTGRGFSPHYINRFAVMGYEGVLIYEPQGCARGITVPSIIVHGTNDLFSPPETARRFYEDMVTDKEFFPVETGNHISLYDEDRCVDQAVDRVTGFLAPHSDRSGSRAREVIV